MNTAVKCPCYVCGKPCTDWNVANNRPSDWFLNVCSTHNAGGAARENGYIRSSHDGQKVIQMKADYNQPLSNTTATPAYPEIACTICGRKNDVGNPKIKSCWFCTSPINYDG